MKRLTLVPWGGLANRLRTIAAAYEYCKQFGYELQIKWICNNDLNCKWNDLFKPLPDFISIQNLHRYYSMIYSVPCQRNLYLPYFYQKLHYDTILHQKDISTITNQKQLIHKYASGDSIFIRTYTQFYDTSSTIYSQLFKPIDHIKQMIDNYTNQFNNNTYGMHIRRSDNLQSISGSPLHLFDDKISSILSQSSNAKFFIATDSEEVKSFLRNKYGNNRIITANSKADRQSVHGMVDAVAELFALTKTKYFYGSFYSSFSDIIIYLRNLNGEILKTSI